MNIKDIADRIMGHVTYFYTFAFQQVINSRYYIGTDNSHFIRSGNEFYLQLENRNPGLRFLHNCYQIKKKLNKFNETLNYKIN
jgi:hypothetical protein